MVGFLSVFIQFKRHPKLFEPKSDFSSIGDCARNDLPCSGFLAASEEGVRIFRITRLGGFPHFKTDTPTLVLPGSGRHSEDGENVMPSGAYAQAFDPLLGEYFIVAAQIATRANP